MTHNLFDAHTSCLCFLSSVMWSEFDADVQALLTILQKKICEMGDRAEGQKTFNSKSMTRVMKDSVML